MQLVRCDACGAKAMLAASQCPKCAEPLYVRNDRGDEVRLVRCRSCETYYPASRDGCRWCAAVTRSPVPRRAGKVAVAVVTIAASLGGWQFVRADSSPPPAPNVMAMPAAVPRLASVAVVGSPARPFTQRAKVPASMVTDTRARRVQPAPSAVATSAPVKQTSTPAAREPRPTGDAGWSELVSAKATTWVNVRAEANGTSAIVGIILPDSVVELGESRRGWRRVSTRWFSGWASAKLFTVDSPTR
jgi:DNA-directed RNA polymerase subunit M/transcription elongation factor TFIIS